MLMLVFAVHAKYYKFLTHICVMRTKEYCGLSIDIYTCMRGTERELI